MGAVFLGHHQQMGIDVAVKVSHILAGSFGDRLELPPWAEALAQPDRLGVKTGSGFYLYGKYRLPPIGSQRVSLNIRRGDQRPTE